MSGECDFCGEHVLDCECDEEKRVGLLFSMPNGKTMEIRSSSEVNENIGSDEKVEGIVYKIYWDSISLPWCTETLLQATAIAFGCQWGAEQMWKKLNSLE